MARIRKIDQIINDETVVVTNSGGPSAQDIIDALELTPDKSKPVDVFLDFGTPESMGLLVTTVGYNPETNAASIVVMPDTRPDDSTDAGPRQGMFPRPVV